MTIERPTAADRAMRIVTAFHLSDEDEEMGEEIFDITEELVHGAILAETEEELEEARMAIANTFIMLAALVDGIIDHCPKDVQLPALAEQLSGSLA